MNPEKYERSNQIKNVCRLYIVMSGHTMNGLPPGELAKALDTSPSNMTRMLAQLKHEGFVEEAHIPGRWRLGPKVVQIAIAYSNEIARAESRLAEVKNRYTREL